MHPLERLPARECEVERCGERAHADSEHHGLHDEPTLIDDAAPGKRSRDARTADFARVIREPKARENQ